MKLKEVSLYWYGWRPYNTTQIDEWDIFIFCLWEEEIKISDISSYIDEIWCIIEIPIFIEEEEDYSGCSIRTESIFKKWSIVYIDCVYGE